MKDNTVLLEHLKNLETEIRLQNTKILKLKNDIAVLISRKNGLVFDFGLYCFNNLTVDTFDSDHVFKKMIEIASLNERLDKLQNILIVYERDREYLANNIKGLKDTLCLL